MAVARELDQDQWRAWLLAAPPMIQTLATDYPPDRLYRERNSGRLALIDRYRSDGSVTVTLYGVSDLVMHDRHVEGIQVADLDEVEMPKPSDALVIDAIVPEEAKQETFDEN